MNGNNAPYKTLLQNLFAYQKSVSQAPGDLLREILCRINAEYKLIGLVDIGAEGAILAVQTQLDEKRVLKIANPFFNEPGKQKWTVRGFLSFEKEEENEFRRRFIEGTKLQRLLFCEQQKEKPDFFYVPNVYRLESTPGLFVEMEWIDGIHILRWARENNDLGFSLRLFMRVLLAIEFFHGFGVVHRDLKTENIMVSGKPGKEKIAIVDWTMAKVVGEQRELTMPGVKMGTSPYASPKLIIDGLSRDVNYTDDIFSLGVILYEFATLNAVPRIQNAEILKQDRDALKKYLLLLENKIPERLRRVFHTATELDESLRYQSIEPIIFEVDKALEDMGLKDGGEIVDVDEGTVLDRLYRLELEFKKISDIEANLQKILKQLSQIGELLK